MLVFGAVLPWYPLRARKGLAAKLKNPVASVLCVGGKTYFRPL